MTTLTEKIVHGRMERSTNELETSLRLSGKIFESVTLGLADTTLEREVLPDGSRGEIKISTQENDDLLGSSVTYQNYLLSEGRLVSDAQSGERAIGTIRRAIVLAKIALGRVDHWDKTSDFYGTTVEYDEE